MPIQHSHATLWHPTFYRRSNPEAFLTLPFFIDLRYLPLCSVTYGMYVEKLSSFTVPEKHIVQLLHLVLKVEI